MEENEAVANTNNTSIKVFPNPAVNSFRIIWNNESRTEIVSAKLSDAYGKTVWMLSKIESSNLNNMQVDVSKFSAGIYTLQIINDAGNINTTKVIVNR